MAEGIQVDALSEPFTLTAVLDIACDESGAEGEKLAHGETRLFTHASVAISTDAAEACVTELRKRINSPATQYKATHLLRPQNRSALDWFLGPAGPVRGNARVVVLDKEHFLMDAFLSLASNGNAGDRPARLLDARSGFSGQSSAPSASALAQQIHAAGGEQGWSKFLDIANGVLRGRPLDERPAPVEELAELVHHLRRSPEGADATALAWLAGRSDRLGALAENQSRASTTRVIIDPLFWAIARTVQAWSGGTRPVAVIHDRQLSITGTWVAELMTAFPAAGSAAGLTDFTIVASTSDARVQIADFMAGIARRTITAVLRGAADPALITMLRPYLDLDPLQSVMDI